MGVVSTERQAVVKVRVESRKRNSREKNISPKRKVRIVREYEDARNILWTESEGRWRENIKEERDGGGKRKEGIYRRQGDLRTSIKDVGSEERRKKGK